MPPENTVHRKTAPPWAGHQASTVAAAPPPTPNSACPTAAQWQQALHTVVLDLTNRPESDGSLLVLINSDGTQPIVKAAA